MTCTGHYTTKKQFYTLFLCNISSGLYLCSKNRLQFCITDLFATLYRGIYKPFSKFELDFDLENFTTGATLLQIEGSS